MKVKILTTVSILLLAALAAADSLDTESTYPKCEGPGFDSGVCINNRIECCPDGNVFIPGDLCDGYSTDPKVVCCGKPQVAIPASPPSPHKHHPSSHKKSDKKAKARFDKSTDGWHRSDCEHVAKTWLRHKVMYGWTPNTKQFVSEGKGPYRPDCSGFVSATWNVDPRPIGGWNTAMFHYKRVSSAADLERCDAVLCSFCMPGVHHAALFWGWSKKTGRPIMVEEYDWKHPITMREWPYSFFNRFTRMRRKEWF